MNLFGYELSLRRQKAAVSPLTSSDIPSLAGLTGRSWWPLVRESKPGAWQRGELVSAADLLTHSTAWSCITLIAFDIAKLCLELKRRDDDGIWSSVENPAYSPVLRKPNHYQNLLQFLLSWMVSKLTRGNTYVLKERDQRGVVMAMDVLDPHRVQPLVSPDGQVYYHCAANEVAGFSDVTVPASEIIHDVYIAPYHPLCGVSPVIACAMAVEHGLQILGSTSALFQNGAQPGGVLTAPHKISEEAAKRIEDYWARNFTGDNVGKVAVLGDGLKFERMALTAVESEIIKQLNWGDERVCSVYHVPGYMVGVGPSPAIQQGELLNQQYYSQCLQIHVEAIERLVDEGLGLASDTTVEFDIQNGLFRMDTPSKMKAATDGTRGGIYTPNEARKMFNLPPIKGGDTVYMQEQDHALEALFARDQGPNPFGGQAPAAAAPPASADGTEPPEPPEPEADAEDAADMTEDDATKVADLLRKELETYRKAAA